MLALTAAEYAAASVAIATFGLLLAVLPRVAKVGVLEAEIDFLKGRVQAANDVAEDCKSREDRLQARVHQFDKERAALKAQIDTMQATFTEGLAMHIADVTRRAVEETIRNG